MHSIRLEDTTLEGLEAKIKDYEERWPSPGYGTYIKKPKFDEILKMWVATGVRSNTCD